MAAAFNLKPLLGPIRLRVTSQSPVQLRILTGPISIRLLGQPGPQGTTGSQGEQGNQCVPGITILPTDAPINGGFF